MGGMPLGRFGPRSGAESLHRGKDTPTRMWNLPKQRPRLRATADAHRPVSAEEEGSPAHRGPTAGRGAAPGLPCPIRPVANARRRTAAPRSYQSRVALTIFTTDSMTGTSISTPTTVARAAPDSKPNKLMAAATASSKKLLAPISAEGAATQCASPLARFSRYARVELK